MAIGSKIVVDLGTEMEEIEAVTGRVPNPGAVPKTDMRIEGKVEITTEIGTGLSLDMFILPENVLMITQVEIPITPKAHS